MGLSLMSKQFAGACEVGRGVDLNAEPRGRDQADRNAHTRFERAQLLEVLALFEHAARQLDKALEGLAAIGVEADMLVMRPFTPGHHRLAEIKRAGRSGWVGKAGDDLVDAGTRECCRVRDYRGERGDVGIRVGEAI